LGGANANENHSHLEFEPKKNLSVEHQTNFQKMSAMAIFEIKKWEDIKEE